MPSKTPSGSLWVERAAHNRLVAGSIPTWLIHKQNRAGIMVTHDLCMCAFVDRVLQVQDGKPVKIYTGKEEIANLIKGGNRE